MLLREPPLTWGKRWAQRARQRKNPGLLRSNALVRGPGRVQRAHSLRATARPICLWLWEGPVETAEPMLLVRRAVALGALRKAASEASLREKAKL